MSNRTASDSTAGNRAHADANHGLRRRASTPANDGSAVVEATSRSSSSATSAVITSIAMSAGPAASNSTA